VQLRRRITAWTLLLGLLALPVLSLASGDACCAGSSPCAPGSGPCASVGALPCCSADRGTQGTAGSAAPAAVIEAPAAARVLPALTDASPAACGVLPGPARALRLSVVLRI
jgi:hypothetical protein